MSTVNIVMGGNVMTNIIEEAIEHFKRIIQATTDTEEKYNEGFVDGLEFCILHLSSILNTDSMGGKNRG